MDYKKRLIESEISELFKIFPIVSITGSRQSGKSTLIKHFTEKHKGAWKYYSLDDRYLLEEIKSDPTLFVNSIKSNIAIDEAQKAPDLFHSLKHLVDQGSKHKIILSGSANFLLLKSITESLAGRVGLLEMQPFSIAEALQLKSNQLVSRILQHDSIDDLHSELLSIENKQISDDELLEFVLYGGYPKIYELNKKDRLKWFRTYTGTYIERDLRDLSQIANLDAFQKVYRLLAFQTAQILNMTNLAQDADIDAKTVKNYFSILQSSYQCTHIPAYFSRARKQIIKKPKILFYDTGLVNFHQNNSTLDQMMSRGYWGHILETHVFSEFHKEIKNMNTRIFINFWRTNNGAEVDFILEHGQKLYPIEIKSATHINLNELRGLESFMEAEQKKVSFGIVFHRTNRVHFLKKNIIGIPINMLF